MVRVGRFLVGLAVTAFAVPALAQGPAHKAAKAHAAPAKARIAPAAKATGLSSAFEASIALVAAEHPAKSEESRLPAQARHLPTAKKCSIGTSCGYHRMFAYLVITRDIQVPGAPEMALRLLPTTSALAGDSHSTIVLRPRVKGSYGVDVAARF